MAVDVEGDQVRPLGFVHAAFAPNAELSDLDLTEGIVSQLKIVPGEQAEEVGAGLLHKAMEFLKSKGATNVNVGREVSSLTFLFGDFMAAAACPGVLEQDELTQKLLLAAGFEIRDKIIVMERNLAGFRTLMGPRPNGPAAEVSN